jgi:hypothetical protein
VTRICAVSAEQSSMRKKMGRFRFARAPRRNTLSIQRLLASSTTNSAVARSSTHCAGLLPWRGKPLGEGDVQLPCKA